MSTPEVRQSPDGTQIAVRFNNQPFWSVQAERAELSGVADELVSNWTPLLPVSNQDGALEEARPATLRAEGLEAVRYNQLWSRRINSAGMERYLRITKVGNSRAEGYTWREGENGGRVTRILKQTIATKWTLLEDQHGGAA